LIHTFSVFYNLFPKDREDFLVEGEYPFAWDYFSDYSQNGVALEISAVIDGVSKQLYTYTRRFPCCLSVLNPESHSESSFVITKIHRDNRGNFIVEAEFDALFIGDEAEGPTDIIKKVKGKVRYPVYFPE